LQAEGFEDGRMDRLLEEMLAEGLSLAAMGRRLGVHESTVAERLSACGLHPVNPQKHAARGGLSREQLVPLIDAGMSIAQIAEEVDRSKATVRHWLRTYGLKTLNQRRATAGAARSAGLQRALMTCAKHGLTEFVLEGRGYYRCGRCRAQRVSERRRKIKQTLVAEAGGACASCGYSRCLAALQFHHVDPGNKRFHLSMQGVSRSLARARAEAAKCVLLCANCHAEVEHGVSTIPEPH
jgi:AraC-like DNA-binding protein